MQNRQFMSPARATVRGGIATLEFVLALPVLLLLMVAITWLGYSVIGQSEVLVKARNNAWKRRFEDASKKPLVFSATPLYSQKSDYVTERATAKVSVSPMFDRLPGPEASHTVLAGSWDSQAMPLNGPPNWKLHMVAVANAKTAGLQTALGNLENLDSLIADVASNALSQVAKDALGGGGGGSGGGGGGTGSGTGSGSPTPGGGTSVDDLGSGIDSQSPNTSAEENKQNADRDKKKAELTAERDRLNQEIDQSQKELDKLLEEQSKLPNPFEDKPPQGTPPPAGTDPPKEDPNKTPTSKRRAQQIEILQTKIKRLKSDLKDVNAELKAAD